MISDENMGGFGSGRREYSSNPCTDDYLNLDIRRWQRDGLLTLGRSFTWSWRVDDEVVASINAVIQRNQVIIGYRHREPGTDWKDERCSIKLDWTPCNYGGQRAWFICPNVGCGKRVAILHRGNLFACRHCHRLAYRSQRESREDRLVRRAEKIRERLDWPGGILNDSLWKPKGMHWRTFHKLEALHDALVSRVIGTDGNRYDLGDLY